MKMDPDDASVEAHLRMTAPTLPPHLRDRVLRRCLDGRSPTPQRRRSGVWRWTWALASISALHGIVIGSLDRQQAALIAGKNGPGQDASRSAASTGAPSAEARDRAALSAFQLRSRLLKELQNG
jgi:hypothetical protein